MLYKINEYVILTTNLNLNEGTFFFAHFNKTKPCVIR